MATLTLFYIVTTIAVILLVYTIFRYYNHPRRKLLKAKKNKEFYFFDHPNDVRKKVEFIYKGCLFEGEKHLGINTDMFRVVSIHITVRDSLDLQGFTQEDLSFLEQEILLRYPDANIQWQYPINQLLQKRSKSAME